MKKRTTTKKSGTIAYQLYERNDLTGRATKKNPAMAGKLIAIGSKNQRQYTPVW